MQIALFGGVYSNYLALGEAVIDARRRGVDAIYCLGDFGAFGPHPDRTLDLLREHGVRCIQGNYDHSIGNGLADCQCGYTDPRDNHFAQLSYDYTLAKTAAHHREWMRNLPQQLRLDFDGTRALLCHGSPRRMNEFLWESTTSTQFLEHLCEEHGADLVLGTHTGIKWRRELRDGRQVVNVGVLGRPENDGNTFVWYTLIERTAAGQIDTRFIPIKYDHQRLAREMREEALPEAFIDTILTGWWTTCLEVLPSKERRRGRY